MTKHLLLIGLSLACFGYAIYSINELVLKDPTPFSIKCIGVVLDPTKIYRVGNRASKPPGTIQIDYPQGQGLLPDQLGTISLDPNSGKFALIIADNISGEIENKTNPFFAFARPTEKGWLGEYRFFNADERIDEATLGNGILFNSPSGDKFSRVTLRLLYFSKKKFLSASTEGIGVKYQLEAGKSNKISVICNLPLASKSARIYRFEKSTDKECSYTIDVTPNAGSVFLGLDFKVVTDDGRVVASGDQTTSRFEVGDYLFELSPAFDHVDLIALFFGLICLAAFQAWYLRLYDATGQAPVQAFLAVKILLNCLAFLSVPIFLRSLSMSDNRMYYWGALLFLNVMCSLPPAIWHRSDWMFRNLDRRWVKFPIMALLVALPFLVQHFSSNEKFLGIPVLHWQKIAILGVILASQYFFGISSWNGKTLAKFILILVYAATLSVLSSDLGSFLYCLIAISIIVYFRFLPNKKYLATAAALAIVTVISGYYFSPDAVGSLANGKGYRLLAPYVSPDNPVLGSANEADRETYANLNLIQKQLVDGRLSEMNDLVVPASMRSTAFSDFAFFWSLAFGRWVFGTLFGLAIIFLTYQLLFLLILTIRPIQIGHGKAYMLPASRESEYIQFLIALSIVSFIYPVLSNLLIVPLTGQSLPCISISLIEPLVLLLLVLPLASVFTNSVYVQPNDDTIKATYRGVLNMLKKEGAIVLAVFFALLLLKWWLIQEVPIDYRWRKSEKEDRNEASSVLNQTAASNVDSLLKAAKDLIGTDHRTAVAMNKKPALRDLTSLYYAKQPYGRIRIENAKFELTTDGLLRRMNVMSYISVRSTQIASESGPFGKVMAYKQLINGKDAVVYSNDFYSSIPANSKTIKADLTAEFAKALREHLDTIGMSSNRGAILVIDNLTGGVLANSSYPLAGETNSNEIHYFIGSLKKTILAYSALNIDSRYKTKMFHGMSFASFLSRSDDLYAAMLLKDVMMKHELKFGDVLENDFGIPLTSETKDAYFDKKPARTLYARELDENNEIYRYSIGQEKPYRFRDVVEWYARIAAGNKIELNYTGSRNSYDPLSINTESLKSLREAMSGVLSGTADNVGRALERNGLGRGEFIGKTGTAESESGKFNTSSSIIIANKRYTIGIMLNGQIPHNSSGLAAKDLMVTAIPILKKHRIL